MTFTRWRGVPCICWASTVVISSCVATVIGVFQTRVGDSPAVADLMARNSDLRVSMDIHSGRPSLVTRSVIVDFPNSAGAQGGVVGAIICVPSISCECWEIGASFAAARMSRNNHVRSSLRCICIWNVTLHRANVTLRSSRMSHFAQ
jgi:hypothetical protein